MVDYHPERGRASEDQCGDRGLDDQVGEDAVCGTVRECNTYCCSEESEGAGYSWAEGRSTSSKLTHVSPTKRVAIGRRQKPDQERIVMSQTRALATAKNRVVRV